MLCYLFSRLVYQRKNNKNTDIAVLKMYCNDLKQNGELIFKILQETIQTIYDVFLFAKESMHSNIKNSIRFSTCAVLKLPGTTRCFHTTVWQEFSTTGPFSFNILLHVYTYCLYTCRFNSLESNHRDDHAGNNKKCLLMASVHGPFSLKHCLYINIA